MNKCIGTCCENFYFSMPVAELRKKIIQGAIAGKPYIANTPGEAEFLLDMLIELETIPGNHGIRATCRHFNKATRRCTVYSRRPSMCRGYPHNKTCKNEGCTFRGGIPMKRGKKQFTEANKCR